MHGRFLSVPEGVMPEGANVVRRYGRDYQMRAGAYSRGWERERSGRCQPSPGSDRSAQPDTLARTAPYLDCQTWDTGELADVGSDHGQAVGNAGGRHPEIMRPNHPACRSQFSPHLCMGPGGSQIYWQQGKALQDGFDKGSTFGPNLGCTAR
ncbi:MAG: hypothetical protein HYZ81_18445 [Nitrospinae bacterium]|nr:hypothetical protein [Nitrospinota bacterium]